MSDADRAAAEAWHDYMNRVWSGEITLAEANALADRDPLIEPRTRDLKRHSLVWRLRGLPIFDTGNDAEDDEIVGVVTADLWPWDDLTPEQRNEVSALVGELVDGGATEDTAWAWACDQMGVTCNHRWVGHEPEYRECPRCMIWERLPGRVVMLGDKRVRVPDPPPMIWRVPRRATVTALMYARGDAPPTVDIEVDEYRWTGTRYEVASR